jgi:hypothetical protein
MGDVLKRRKAAGGDGVVFTDPGSCDVFVRYPGLWSMLALRAYPDGVARQTATLLLFIDGGQLKVCLNDRDQELQAWATGASLHDLLGALEAGLQADTLDWRASGKRIARKATR